MRLFYELITKKYDKNSIYEMDYFLWRRRQCGIQRGYLTLKLAEIICKKKKHFQFHIKLPGNISITHFILFPIPLFFFSLEIKCILFKMKNFECNEMKIGYLLSALTNNQQFGMKEKINRKINIFNRKSVHIYPSKSTNSQHSTVVTYINLYAKTTASSSHILSFCQFPQGFHRTQ